MKKWISLVLVLGILLATAMPVLAASDLDVATDKALNTMINAYGNVTVRAGAALSMPNWRPDPPGLEIGNSLVVEAGGAITGGSIIFERGATCTGMDFYYVAGGVVKLLPVEITALYEVFPQSDYRPTFYYDIDTGRYVLHGNEFEADPFETPPPNGGENSGGNAGPDARTIRIADGLKALGLFQGVGTHADGSPDFDLERTPSRVEALVLLIRLLGQDSEASAYPKNYSHDDVADWAKGYITYAFDTGLTNGVGDGVLGEGDATVEQFLTFVLRSMGYSDTNGADFTWDAPVELAMSLGLIGGEGDLQSFNRGTCVRIMEAALRNSMKGGGRLADRLIAQGVFTREAYEAAFE